MLTNQGTLILNNFSYFVTEHQCYPATLDKFVHDLFPTLPEIRNKAATDREPLLYMYDYYNVHCFTTNPLSISCRAWSIAW